MPVTMDIERIVGRLITVSAWPTRFREVSAEVLKDSEKEALTRSWFYPGSFPGETLPSPYTSNRGSY